MKNIIIFIILLFISVTVFSQNSEVLENIPDTKIDWINNKYIAVGMGKIPSIENEPNRPIGLLKAKENAKKEAIKNLFKLIEETVTDYKSKGSDYMSESLIKKKIQGFVDNISFEEAKKYNFEGEEVIVVKCVSNIYGEKNPGTILLNESLNKDRGILTEFKEIQMSNIFISNSKFPIIMDLPSENTEDWVDKSVIYKEAVRSKPENPYTGVIFDVSQFKFQKSLNPKIRLENGDVIWSAVLANEDIISEKGIVSYWESWETINKNSRAGNNPLIINVINVAGNDNFKTDFIITDADAEILKAENEKSKFLNNLNIVIVKNIHKIEK